jgi:hypothetical protein
MNAGQQNKHYAFSYKFDSGYWLTKHGFPERQQAQSLVSSLSNMTLNMPKDKKYKL